MRYIEPCKDQLGPTFEYALVFLSSIMPDQKTILEQCQKNIGYRFKNPALLKEALTHSSGADTPLTSNERLEFLGDSVLGFVVCERLFHQFPEIREGGMTQIKSSVVSRITCQSIGKKLALDECLFVGKGVGRNTRISPSMLADMIESLIAAIYLDGGLGPARKFIEKHFGPEIDAFADSVTTDNFKSLLQQVAQRDFGHTPEYRVLEIKGPEHGKCFRIGVRIGKTIFQSAWGNNKKEAEQRAAENALYILQGEEAPYFGGE